MNEPDWIKEHRRKTVVVVAAPLGFYGRAYDLWLGPRRDSADEARCDAHFAADCIDATPIGVLV